MKIFLTGANGFIGSHLLAALVADGHDVVAAVRQPAALLRRFPQIKAIQCDMNRDLRAELWRPRLAGIDVVINCAGALQRSVGQDLSALHAIAPMALFDAATQCGISRVIQISAISSQAETEYAKTKTIADRYLQERDDLNWIVLRPSLVMGQLAYGGTALLRALSAFPFCLPLPGKGQQSFDPVTMDDIVKTVLVLLARPDIRCQVIEPVGPRRVTVSELLKFYRGWLGVVAAPVVHVPMVLVRLSARVGDWFGQGALTTTSIRQIEYGNCGNVAQFSTVMGFTPVDPLLWLTERPSGVADLWQARLMLLRPVLRVLLVVLWLASGIMGALTLETATSQRLMQSLGLSNGVGGVACLWDMILAGLLAFNIRPFLTLLLQLGTVLAYTVMLTLADPALWQDPLGPLLKNLPIMGLMLVQATVARER